METLTTMSYAFQNAKVTKSTGAAVINTCARAMRNRPWVVDEGKNGWNAHLSFRTAKKLNAPEFDNPRAKMPHDDMMNAS